MPEFIINKMYVTKFGEVCIGMKFKKGELTPEQIEKFRTYWEEGTPLKGTVEEYQVPPTEGEL